MARTTRARVAYFWPFSAKAAEVQARDFGWNRDFNDKTYFQEKHYTTRERKNRGFRSPRDRAAAALKQEEVREFYLG